ncbi:succinate dehydrogenase [Marine Group I thaumarchaeote]|jgi:succinate dehydrogenase / fumarate reductase membrane anchor subunit|uniref:Succinate dehydrogenase n=2 Tax=Nitrososphaerota TaxID=651137 RepID=A0A7K4MMN6_9ARCH|nr:succinate dehydrogenase [Marine Group I thaumarchaeote]PBO82731.1 MAG: succinate dehydrogenase [Nitrosopumilales archaeon]NWJ42835.1 succinate dehydrogenase [Marine Group I thaumarchaeote]NWJ67756.1 succinate dehydrogenase [Marine Group I thaumarchaeote]NWJ99360.1 succinate dehydrogenase [Marine Group I thaumarchaeote]
MRESHIMKIHYLTALVAVGFVIIHIMVRVMQGFSDSLLFDNVIANYKSIPYAIVLEAMLILISVHGFNGLRIILLEIKQGRVYENAVTYGCLAAMIILIAYGSRTIIMASMGMV